MRQHVVTLNAGSSSIKFALFRVEADRPMLIAKGQAEGLGATPSFRARILGRDEDRLSLAANDHEAATRAIVDWIGDAFPDINVSAVGHRIVHGGVDYAGPVLLDAPIIAALQALIPLAPLHQPHNLAGVAAARTAFPGVPQIACFDTAFHRGHQFVNDAYALPRALYDRGLRRFGFHGLSYEFIARRLREIDPPRAKARVIVAHLGNGASVCAMKDGRSIASTMGFSALDGLPMGTRCGQVDPGLLLYLLEHDGISTAELSRLLYRESGLLGLSGVSQDMRALEASSAPFAQEAIDYFVHRVGMDIAALAATIEGVDSLVFTGGIGEHSARIRADVVAKLGWLGLACDRDANEAHAQLISTPASSASIYALATDEEAMIAQHVVEAIGLSPAAAA
ncbi:MAG: acetate/propionate family kinase [Methylocystis sp.]|uniref:acetate/propionate family kinase n=1 Tax=Methylocystis sp. TaxID=1911079 RepID=UPI003D0B1FC6